MQTRRDQRSRSCCALEPVDTAAALASGSTTRPPLPQPWASALPVLLGSGPSPFEATCQPSKGRPGTEGLRPNPLTGTLSEYKNKRDLMVKGGENAAQWVWGHRHFGGLVSALGQ